MITMAGLLLVFGFVAGLLMLIAAPIVLAMFVVGVVLRAVLFVLLLPVRIVGGLFGFALPAVALVLLLLVFALPLMPVFLIGAGIYLVVRGMRPRASRTAAPVTPSPGS